MEVRPGVAWRAHLLPQLALDVKRNHVERSQAAQRQRELFRNQTTDVLRGQEGDVERASQIRAQVEAALQLHEKNGTYREALGISTAANNTLALSREKLEILQQDEQVKTQELAKKSEVLNKRWEKHQEALKVFEAQNPKERSRSFQFSLDGEGADPDR